MTHNPNGNSAVSKRQLSRDLTATEPLHPSNSAVSILATQPLPPSNSAVAHGSVAVSRSLSPVPSRRLLQMFLPVDNHGDSTSGAARPALTSVCWSFVFKDETKTQEAL